jgi:hypothetical protein
VAAKEGPPEGSGHLPPEDELNREAHDPQSSTHRLSIGPEPTPIVPRTPGCLVVLSSLWFGLPLLIRRDG